MTSLQSVVIAEPVRTAIGTFGGTLKDVPAVDLGAVAIRAAVQRAGLQPHAIGTVVMGRAGRQQDESGTASDDSRRTAGPSPRHDSESGLRLGCAGDCVGCA